MGLCNCVVVFYFFVLVNCESECHTSSGGGRGRLDWKKEKQTKIFKFVFRRCDFKRLPKGHSQQGDLFLPHSLSFSLSKV